MAGRLELDYLECLFQLKPRTPGLLCGSECSVKPSWCCKISAWCPTTVVMGSDGAAIPSGAAFACFPHAAPLLIHEQGKLLNCCKK